MNYINIQTTVLRHDAMTDATSAQKGVWLTLMGYCVEQENGGRIRGVFAWNEIKVAKALGVAKTELLEASPLWKQKGDDLELEFYPREKQRIVQSKRKSAHAAAIARWANRATTDTSSDVSEESDSPSDNGCVLESDNGMRKGMEGNGREEKEKGIPPLPPKGEKPSGDVIQGSDVPDDSEILKWAKEWPGDPARGIPGVIPEGYVLGWIAWRKGEQGPWPRDWQGDLKRRFTRDWIENKRGARTNTPADAPAPVTHDPAALARQIRTLEAQLETHPGNPDNGIGSLARKEAAAPEFKALSTQLSELKRRLVKA